MCSFYHYSFTWSFIFEDYAMSKKECVTFSEIFKYAETKHGIHWNPCNDLFFNTGAIKYNGFKDHYKFDMADPDLLGVSINFDDDSELIDATMRFVVYKDKLFNNGRIADESYARSVADTIIDQFMIENDLGNEILILGD